ncbi:MAG: DUF4314 domain-containing protein [Clostridia bacterium]|nr:DUF4314 domain-containing protein [Clostridia bacterium]
MIKQSELESLRQQYPVGARVELIEMNDPFSPPPPGTKGTVRYVDDIGNIHVDWDNGSGLAVTYPVDRCKVLNYVKTICYGTERTFDDRQEAIDFYENCVVNSEGSERERYVEILIDLRSGKLICSDKVE